jgi:transcriptional regulator with XRE-family HTH domain
VPAAPWFTSDLVREASQQRQYGVILREARLAAGFSQTDVGQRIGASMSAVSRYETGHVQMERVPGLLRRASRALGIPPRLFDLPEDDPTTGSLAVTDVDTEVVRAMQRRHVLSGLAMSAAALPALRVRALPLLSQLDAAVFSPHVGVQPLALPRVARELALARKHFAACQFRQLAAVLPDLIALAQASRDEADHDQRGGFDAVLAQVYVLGNELAIKLHENGAAWVMAERGLAAARASGDPRVLARAQWRTAISLRRSKHAHAASSVISRAADDLHQATALESADDAGFYVRMLCCAAYTEALAERADNAYSLLTAARETVSAHPYSPFGFDAIDLYGISVARAVGDFGHAVTFSGQVRVARLDSIERMTRYWEDTAIAWWGAGRPDKTFEAMRRAEAIAPQEVRLRPWAHRLTENLRHCPRGTTGLDGLREFSARIGLGTVC